MNPAELQLFNRRVVEFEHLVARYMSCSPKLRAELQREITVQQQWFKERPWVSHFVPHLDVVRRRLNNFETSSHQVSQSAPPIVGLGVITQYGGLLSYMRSSVKVPVYPDPVHVKECYRGTSLARRGPHNANKRGNISQGFLATKPTQPATNQPASWLIASAHLMLALIYRPA